MQPRIGVNIYAKLPALDARMTLYVGKLAVLPNRVWRAVSIYPFRVAVGINYLFLENIIV